jgi:SAM-dependent methyltransferase
MEKDNAILNLLSYPLAYRTLERTISRKKLKPLFEYNDVRRFKKVLDVGCGTGACAEHFGGPDYVGIDINPRYIAYARRTFQGTFEVADATRYAPASGVRFDSILSTSFLHHIDDQGVTRIMKHMSGLLEPDGRIHVLDLILPDRHTIAWYLAKADRGRYPRSLGAWEKLFSEHFELDILRPYPIAGFGVPLWNMVYARGKTRA